MRLAALHREGMVHTPQLQSEWLSSFHTPRDLKLLGVCGLASWMMWRVTTMEMDPAASSHENIPEKDSQGTCPCAPPTQYVDHHAGVQTYGIQNRLQNSKNPCQSPR